MTARRTDKNGWIEIRKNPISRVGVFPYSGKAIGGPDPNKTYMVFRPPEELGSQATMDSFRLMPLIDDHGAGLLGPSEIGYKPAEEKGVHGCLGEEMAFDGRTLYAPVKIWSERLPKQIKAGKRELSAAFRCKYDWTPGVFEGVAYDCVQRTMRGNHVALVDKGRMGPEVAVMDHGNTFALDSAEAVTIEPDVRTQLIAFAQDALETAQAAPTGEMGPDLLQKMQRAGQAMLGVINEAMTGEPAGEQTDVGNGDDTMSGNDTTSGDDTNAKGDDTKTKGGEGQDSLTGGSAQDSLTGGAADKMAALEAENATLRGKVAALESRPALDAKDVFQATAARDGLAAKLKPLIGQFDHSGMDALDVAKHGLATLKLTATAGQEMATLNGYLAAASARPVARGVGFDTAEPHAQDGKSDNFVSKYLAPTDAK